VLITREVVEHEVQPITLIEKGLVEL